MPPWARELAKLVIPPVAVAILGYIGLVEPNNAAVEAQHACCPIARECVGGLIHER